MSMTKDEGRKICDAINGALGSVINELTKNTPGPLQSAKPGTVDRPGIIPGREVTSGTTGETPVPAPDFEKLYQKIKARLLDDLRVDPTFVKLLAAMPEILLEIEPRRVQMDDKTLKGRVCKLIADGFLDVPRRPAELLKELARTGGQSHGARLSEALAALRGDGIVTDEDDGYRRAPGLKITRSDVST